MRWLLGSVVLVIATKLVAVSRASWRSVAPPAFRPYAEILPEALEAQLSEGRRGVRGLT